MARPNSTAITTIGRKLATGPVTDTPSGPASQPHWKTATVAPRLAPTESRKPMAALTGTIRDRKTSISSNSDRPTTMLANGSRAAESFAETSTSLAVVRVTATVAPVAWLIGPAWWRMEVTRVAVVAEEGAL